MQHLDQANRILKEYQSIKNLASKDKYVMQLPDLREKYDPIFQLNVDKEVEILANKFRIMSTPGVDKTISSPQSAVLGIQTKTDAYQTMGSVQAP